MEKGRWRREGGEGKVEKGRWRREGGGGRRILDVTFAEVWKELLLRAHVAVQLAAVDREGEEEA